MMARLEKVLHRADDLYRTLAREGCEFTIFPSPEAFQVYLDRAKENGGVFKEGDWDSQRDPESRVWRSVEPSSSAENASADISTEEKAGYWVKTDVYDLFNWFERPDVQFV